MARFRKPRVTVTVTVEKIRRRSVRVRITVQGRRVPPRITRHRLRKGQAVTVTGLRLMVPRGGC
jgi:hypothetical protein